MQTKLYLFWTKIAGARHEVTTNQWKRNGISANKTAYTSSYLIGLFVLNVVQVTEAHPVFQRIKETGVLLIVPNRILVHRRPDSRDGILLSRPDK